MYQSSHAGQHASRASRFWWWPSLLLAAAWLPGASSATCLVDADPEIHRLQDLIGQDATQALAQAKSALQSAQRESVSDNSHGALQAAARIAALYAVEAEAYGILELDADA